MRDSLFKNTEMKKRNNQADQSQQQTADDPARESNSNPFENGQTADQEIQQAEEELEKEQQFKEAQSERD